MFDFTTTQLTTNTASYCLFMYVAIFVLFYKSAFARNDNSQAIRAQWLIFFAMLFVIVITNFVGGDFYHYQKWCFEYNFNSDKNHGEPIYAYVVKLAGKNYLLFRILIWGTGLVLIKDSCRRLRINKFCTFFFIFAAFLITYSYARASFAMAVYYWGLSFMISDKSRRAKSIGLLIICISFFFHNSMLLCICLTPLIYAPLKRRTILAIIILCPIICVLLGRIFSEYFDQLPGLIDDEYISKKLTRYGSREDEASNWKGMISNVLSFSPYFVISYIIAKYVYFKKVYGEMVPFVVKSLSIISFALILISVSTFFIGLDNIVLFYRIIFMSFIPLSLLVAKLYQDGELSKILVYKLLWFCFVCLLYKHLYAVYTTLK